MRTEARTTTLARVRRLAVTKQHLAGPLPAKPTKQTLLSVVRDLAYVQWDPVPIVAPSHLLSLRCRLGQFRPADLERLLWEEKRLFQHWTPIASIVLTEDFPIYHSLMQRYPNSLSRSWGSQRTRAAIFLRDHRDLRRRILRQLASGPRVIGQFEDHRRTRRDDGEWTPPSDVAQMLYHLTMRGEVMVVGHEGNQNLWGLSAEFLPTWVERQTISPAEVERRAAERAILALGTATPTEINLYFVRGRYEHLGTTLRALESDGVIHRVLVEGLGPRDERYVHERDLRFLESRGDADWTPRVSLLPPFDNMLHSQARTNLLFGFDYVREQFLPVEKRRYGTYVLPILWGDRFIGRVDPRHDKARQELVINAVHAERDAPGREVAASVAEEIRRLGGFLGAKRVRYTSRVPEAWRSALR